MEATYDNNEIKEYCITTQIIQIIISYSVQIDIIVLYILHLLHFKNILLQLNKRQPLVVLQIIIMVSFFIDINITL